MGDAPEACTATRMAFTSWGMSRGKVYQVHLLCMTTRGSNVGIIHVGGGKFAHGRISLTVPTNWGMEVAHEASAAMGMAFT